MSIENEIRTAQIWLNYRQRENSHRLNWTKSLPLPQWESMLYFLFLLSLCFSCPTDTLLSFPISATYWPTGLFFLLIFGFLFYVNECNLIWYCYMKHYTWRPAELMKLLNQMIDKETYKVSTLVDKKNVFPSLVVKLHSRGFFHVSEQTMFASILMLSCSVFDSEWTNPISRPTHYVFAIDAREWMGNIDFHTRFFGFDCRLADFFYQKMYNASFFGAFCYPGEQRIAKCLHVLHNVHWSIVFVFPFAVCMCFHTFSFFLDNPFKAMIFFICNK